MLEIAENRFIHEGSYNQYKGKNRSYMSGGGEGNYAPNENDNKNDWSGDNGGNTVEEIVQAVMSEEISYNNFFEYLRKSFLSYSQPKKMEIVEAILNAIDDDNEFKKIKELT